jgi:hypothetical protein
MSSAAIARNIRSTRSWSHPGLTPGAAGPAAVGPIMVITPVAEEHGRTGTRAYEDTARDQALISWRPGSSALEMLMVRGLALSATGIRSVSTPAL